MTSGQDQDLNIICERFGSGVVITFNRPEALNALTLGMIRAIRAILATYKEDEGVKALVFKGAGGKAFCAGGDIKAVYHAGVGLTDPAQKAALAKTYFADEYRMNRELFSYPKPIVAMMDGITMGGGFGVAGPCRYRVATENTSFAMPETGIGFFPDVGSMYYLTRVPDRMGHWMALTGHTVNGANMMAFGLASHSMPSSKIEECIAEICKSDGGVQAVLERMHQSHAPKNETLRSVVKIITKAFEHNTVEKILAALDEPGHDFAARTAAIMHSRSPTSLKVTHAHYQKMQGRSFDEVTAMDYRLSIRFALGHDFYEGIRAALIDKDKNPKWTPATLAEVSDSVIASYFADDLPDLDAVDAPVAV